jgi:hypothetical protein
LALFIVYIILIHPDPPVLGSRMPLNPIIRAIVGFVHEVTDPTSTFRRMLPGRHGYVPSTKLMVMIVLLVAQAVSWGS